MKDFEEKNYSELHSEKIRNLINEMPSSLANYGIIIIIIITVALISIGCLMPCPYSEEETIFQYFLC